MLQRLIARSVDLRRLRDEGYDLALSASDNHLLVKKVPYVISTKEVNYGTLIAALHTNGDSTNPPPDHVVHFIGEQPCDRHGIEIGGIRNPSAAQDLDKGLRSDRTFSAKPAEPFTDYYEKMTKYVAILEGPAQAIDGNVTAKTFPTYELSAEESVFIYADTASSRAGISALTAKLAASKVAIVGLGGTGSYVLDFVAKTPIEELHLFDRDILSSHNAFRSPGAVPIAELHNRPTKVAYLQSVYANMRRAILTHEYHIDENNVGELDGMHFVFLCMDGGGAKRAAVERLQARGIPFIDVGMGLEVVDDTLGGILRITTSTKTQFAHVAARVPFADGDVNDEYGKNIQIAELNALNAALAVIRWKKLCGFYLDVGNEHSTVYTLSRNTLINEDIP